MSDKTPRDERVRAPEVIGALCLATDLGMGFPFEHGLQSTLIAMRPADRLGVDRGFGDSLTTRFHPVALGSDAKS